MSAAVLRVPSLDLREVVGTYVCRPFSNPNPVCPSLPSTAIRTRSHSARWHGRTSSSTRRRQIKDTTLTLATLSSYKSSSSEVWLMGGRLTIQHLVQHTIIRAISYHPHYLCLSQASVDVYCLGSFCLGHADYDCWFHDGRE